MKYFYLLIGLILFGCNSQKLEYPKINNINVRGYEDKLDTLNVRIGITGTIFYKGGGLHSSYYVHSLDDTLIEEIYNYPIPEIGKYNTDTIDDYIFERDESGYFTCPNLYYVIVVIKLDNTHRNIISAKRHIDCIPKEKYYKDYKK